MNATKATIDTINNGSAVGPKNPCFLAKSIPKKKNAINPASNSAPIQSIDFPVAVLSFGKYLSANK